MSKRKYTLAHSIMKVIESMGVKAWIHGDRVYHDGPDDLKDEIGENISRVREIGVRGTALFFGACLITAMDRGCWIEDDIRFLDPLGRGNATYVLEKLKEVECV